MPVYLDNDNKTYSYNVKDILNIDESFILSLEQLKTLAISSYNGKYVQDYEESYSR